MYLPVHTLGFKIDSPAVKINSYFCSNLDCFTIDDCIRDFSERRHGISRNFLLVGEELENDVK